MAYQGVRAPQVSQFVSHVSPLVRESCQWQRHRSELHWRRRTICHMPKDAVVTFRAPDGFSPDPLTDLLRQGARDLIAQAVEAKLNAFFAVYADQTDASGRRRLVRHGHLPERPVQTGIGAVAVKVPRVRDRAPEGGRLKFTSTILPPYLRRAKSIDELLP